VQEVPIYTDYTLYPNPDKPITPQPIEVIYDTGAAITMLPEDYPYAWTNTRDCLHILTGCFSGHKTQNPRPKEVKKETEREKRKRRKNGLEARGDRGKQRRKE
jgi:hypothetical protein